MIDHANATSWQAQKDQLLAVDSLRLLVSALTAGPSCPQWTEGCHWSESDRTSLGLGFDSRRAVYSEVPDYVASASGGQPEPDIVHALPTDLRRMREELAFQFGPAPTGKREQNLREA